MRLQDKIVAEVGKEKMTVKLLALNPELVTEVTSAYGEKMTAAIMTEEKLAREAAIEDVKAEAILFFNEKYQDDANFAQISKEVRQIVEDMEKDEVRRLITVDKIRPTAVKSTKFAHWLPKSVYCRVYTVPACSRVDRRKHCPLVLWLRWANIRSSMAWAWWTANDSSTITTSHNSRSAAPAEQEVRDAAKLVMVPWVNAH